MRVFKPHRIGQGLKIGLFKLVMQQFFPRYFYLDIHADDVFSCEDTNFSKKNK